ncbi:MAG TPA: hypothetical protein VGM80_05170 [Gaiellaceae bacterium]
MSSTGVRASLRRRSTTSFSAFLGYALVAFLYLGLRPLIEPGRQYVGFGVDPQIFIWSFDWWPHAILHGQNPFYTHEIWAPSGVNLTWTTSVPGLALVFAPLTLLLGPEVSYDIAATLMPAFAAWTAFLLCRHVTRSFWPSLVGGYLFGFSSYELSQSEGHLHMTSVFLVPLVALVVLRYLEGGLDRRGLALRLGSLFGFEVLLSTEVALTMSLALAVSLLLAAALVPERRPRIVSLVTPLAAAAGFAAILISPFLYYALTGYVASPLSPPRAYIADVLNTFIPTDLSLASFGATGPIVRRFPGNGSEWGSYLGLPVLVILGLYGWRRWRTPAGRFLLAAIGLATVLSLGDELTVGGHRLVWLPWRLVVDAPLIDNVLPVRLVLYAWLAAAVVVSVWATARTGWTRYVLPALAVIAILPNPASGAWSTTFHVPDFFTNTAYRGCLARGETVLPLPVSRSGDSMLWQVADAYRFQMAGGNIAPNAPASFLTSPEVNIVAAGYPVPPNLANELRTYIDTKGVTTVILDEGAVANFYSALALIGKPTAIGGVILVRADGSAPACIAP